VVGARGPVGNGRGADKVNTMNPEYTYCSSEGGADEAAERRMADLARFVDGLVHDLRNPLNVIKTNLYLLRQRIPTDDPKVARSLTRIEDQLAAEERLLESAQAFYRADQPYLQQVQVNELVRRVISTTSVPEGCDLRAELREDLPTVRADPHLVEAALRALIRNAVEAVAGSGCIRVETGCAGTSVRLAVQDDGEGIPEEVLRRVFEPLFTTRRAHGGLGLALVARIARGLGGRVLVGSRVGQGTHVVIELPARNPD
jgi:signal transduction histidine kinase